MKTFKKISAVVFGVAFLALATQATGQTITVNTVNDVVDFGGLQQVGDLPGPDGIISFREACIAANNTPGPQTIAFAIPQSDWWLFTNMALLRLENGVFPLTDDGTTVDFTTQTAFTGDTNPNGGEVGIFGLEPNGWGAQAISITGNNCVIKGLDTVRQRGYAVRIIGNNNRIISCTTTGPLYAAVYVSGFLGSPPPTGNIIGGTLPGEGNVLSAIGVDGPAEGTVVVGNQVNSGVFVRGATQYGAIVNHTRVGGKTPAERNVISGAGKYDEEGFPNGEQVNVMDADNTIVEGNYIGTTADGTARFVPQIGPTGVRVQDSRGTTIRDNVIAGLRAEGVNHFVGQIFGQAIHVGAVNIDSRDTVIENNNIGIAADGITPITTHSGINVVPLTTSHHAFNTVISFNHIASVELTGIFVSPLENGVKMTMNSIHDNGALGIDLSASGLADGPTLNDPGDVDTGANGLQNFPVIQSAVQMSAISTFVQGAFNSAPNQAFNLEFFSSPTCDPTGFGEGRDFLGAANVTTNASGDATFAVTFPVGVQVGSVVTGTATDANNNTSEFSQCRTVTSLGASPTPSPTASPTPSVTPPPPTPTPTPMPTVTPPPSPTPSPSATPTTQTLRSTNITLTAKMARSSVTVNGTITVRNRNGAAVASAAVDATWTLPDGTTQSQSAMTNSRGIASVNVRSGRGTYTLTVNNITKPNYAFDSAGSVLSKSISK